MRSSRTIAATTTGRVGRAGSLARRRTVGRRLLAVAAAIGVVLVAGQAGAALGGGPPATPERRAPVVTYVVQPGDTLWSIAADLAPGADRRRVVDELAAAHGGPSLVPGETITWAP